MAKTIWTFEWIENRKKYLKIWNLRVQKNLYIDKITFKVVQMKSLAIKFYIFTVGNVLNIFMEHDLYLIY